MTSHPPFPINSLPDELLSLIFIAVMNALPYQDQPTFHTITSLVNRRWHIITNSTPALWGIIDFSLGYQTLWLSRIDRSGAIPLEVHYKKLVPSTLAILNNQTQLPTMRPLQERLILQLAHRIRKLSLLWCQMPNKSWSPQLSTKFPQLQVLNLSIPPNDSPPYPQNHPGMPILIQAPELREFILKFPWDWSTVFTHNLTILDVDMEGGAVPMDNFLAVLSMNRQLVTLRMRALPWKAIPVDHYTSRSQETLDFLSLDELVLYWVPRHVALFLLSWIHSPMLKNLVLYVNRYNTAERWFTDGDHLDAAGTSVVNLKSRFRDYPQLDGLQLYTAGFLPGDCSHILSKVPNIHKLSLLALGGLVDCWRELVDYIASAANNFGPQLRYLRTEGLSPRQLIDMATPTGIQGIPYLRMDDYYLGKYMLIGNTPRIVTQEDVEERDSDLRDLSLLVGDIGPSKKRDAEDYLSWDEFLVAQGGQT